MTSLNGQGDLDVEWRRHARELTGRDQVIGKLTVAVRVLKKSGPLRATSELRTGVHETMAEVAACPHRFLAWLKPGEPLRLTVTGVLKALGLATSTWHYHPKASGRPCGRPPAPLDPAQVAVIRALWERYPFVVYHTTRELTM